MWQCVESVMIDETRESLTFLTYRDMLTADAPHQGPANDASSGLDRDTKYTE